MYVLKQYDNSKIVYTSPDAILYITEDDVTCTLHTEENKSLTEETSGRTV